MKRFILFPLVFTLISAGVSGQTVSQWRGKDRNGTYYEKDLLKEWPESGPELLWSTEGIGDGSDSGDNDDDGDKPPLGRQRLDFRKPDRGDGNDGLVKRVERGHPLQIAVSGRPECDHHQEKNQR